MPLYHRIEFFNHYSKFYEEDEYEFNERLIIKKIIFLLLDIAMKEGAADYKEVTKFLNLWLN